MSGLPEESERVLGVGPSDFVAERNSLAKELRESGRGEDAAAIAGMRKPPAPVLAVNRAARDRPQAARAAVEAAARVEKAHGGGDPDAFRAAVRELDEAIDLLAEVAVAHVAEPGKTPTEAMRRRVYDVLRNAVAGEDTRAALGRGALLEEPPVAGFTALAGMAPAPARAPQRRRVQAAQKEKREREKELRQELARAEKELAEAERAFAEAERQKARAERAVSEARSRLDKVT